MQIKFFEKPSKIIDDINGTTGFLINNKKVFLF